MHAGVEIDEELGDDTGNLRADLNSDYGVDGAGGLHDVMNIAALDFGGEVLVLRFGIESKGGEDGHCREHASQKQPFEILLHAGPRQIKLR